MRPSRYKVISWETNYLACLGRLNLAEPIPLQVRTQPISFNQVARLCLEHEAVGSSKNSSSLAGDLHQEGLSPSGAMFTSPPHVSLARQLKWFTGACPCRHLTTLLPVLSHYLTTPYLNRYLYPTTTWEMQHVMIPV
ncbi:hypothetical protein Pmani_014409 [Petrolisthes manimaculis]|uniref:Uncharacterized protein n=1 Tax=Petrolisthes manimaculis TaxID=1843537 RepID=A0AAE1UCM2_9EUCA|nr:hypothetical protein Pmani_014409 [Petrolisthes manimaculis]